MVVLGVVALLWLTLFIAGRRAFVGLSALIVVGSIVLFGLLTVLLVLIGFAYPAAWLGAVGCAAMTYRYATGFHRAGGVAALRQAFRRRRVEPPPDHYDVLATRMNHANPDPDLRRESR